MPKTYAPVRIQNPTSLQQVAKVCPGQDVLIHLDDHYGDVEISGGLLTAQVEVTHNRDGVERRTYRISHPKEIYDWSKYSSVLIGEVWIDGPCMAKVGILMETTCIEKANVKTIINPDCIDLRINPYDLLEVIAYDLEFGYHDEWSCEWQPKIPGLGLNQIGYDHLCLYSWESFYNGIDSNTYTYARYPRAETESRRLTRQHHFWFRFDAKLYEVISKNNSVIYAGQLKILGNPNRFAPSMIRSIYYASLYLDCRKSNDRKQFFEKIAGILTLKPKDHHGSTSLPVKQSIPLVKKSLPRIRDVDIKLVELPRHIVCMPILVYNRHETFR